MLAQKFKLAIKQRHNFTALFTNLKLTVKREKGTFQIIFIYIYKQGWVAP